MNRRQSSLLVAFLSVAGVCLASIQVRAPVCQLRMGGGWLVAERDGLVCLMETGWGKVKNWQIDSPTIRDDKGRYLSSDPAGKDTALRLLDKKGPHTHWIFEITERIEPEKENVGGGEKMLRGEKGFRFTVKVAEGPFRGWFLAAGEPLPDRKQPGEGKARALLLTKDPKEAAVFTYIWVKYDIR